MLCPFFISAIHDLNIAAAYCDKIYVLKDGVLEGYGTPEEVLTPELIRRIYKVEAEIVYDSRGVEIMILFYFRLLKALSQGIFL